MSVWTSPDNFDMPSAADWIDAAKRGSARLVMRCRLPLALTGGLLSALGVLLLLSPDPAGLPATSGRDVGAGVWTRQTDVGARVVLKTTSLSRLEQSSDVWLRERGDLKEREDRLTAGDADADGAYLLLTVTQRAPDETESGFFVSAARHAADAGLSIGRFGRVADAVGRFGATETAQVSLLKASSGTVRRDCLAWRANAAGQSVGIAGFLCLPDDARPDALKVECLLRDLVPSSTADQPFRQLLQPSGGLPGSCSVLAEAARTGPNRVARTRQ